MAEWIKMATNVNISLMADTLKISPLLAQALANRGISSKNTAIRYLKPSRNFMYSAESMKDIELGWQIIQQGLKTKARFCVYGDYDVDGVMSTVIMLKALRSFGAECGFYIPDRVSEGYGLNIAAIENIAKEYDILIAVDNGMSAVAEIRRAKELGLAVVVIDHHEAGAEMPLADAIINTRQADCKYPFDKLCAAGLCYKFAEYIHMRHNVEFSSADEYLAFAAIATICDVVDLVDENRIIAANGLEILQAGEITNLGLSTIMELRNLKGGKIDTYAVGFILGPCINAAGRLESATIAVRLFLEGSEEKAQELALQLIELNDKRKEICTNAAERIMQDITEPLDKVICVYDENIHESIAGIVAGRIKDATGRPTLIFAKSGEVAKGSARSIEKYNVFEEMQKCSDILIKFGGHPMAAGASLAAEKIDELKIRLNDACVLTEEDFIPIIYIEEEIFLDEITYEFAKTLENMEPFGKSNKRPVFVIRSIYTRRVERLGKSETALRLTFSSKSGRNFSAVCFRQMDKFLQMLNENFSPEVAKRFASGGLKDLTVPLSIAANVDINRYKGNSSIQLNILDFKYEK